MEEKLTVIEGKEYEIIKKLGLGLCLCFGLQKLSP